MRIAHLRLDKADGVPEGHGHFVLGFFSARRSARERDAVAGGAPRRATSDHGLRSRSYVWLRRTMYPVDGSSHGALGIQAGKKKRHIAALQKVAGDLALGQGMRPGPVLRPEQGPGGRNNLGHAVLANKAIPPYLEAKKELELLFYQLASRHLNKPAPGSTPWPMSQHPWAPRRRAAAR